MCGLERYEAMLKMNFGSFYYLLELIIVVLSSEPTTDNIKDCFTSIMVIHSDTKLLIHITIQDEENFLSLSLCIFLQGFVSDLVLSGHRT